jgi:hypothetical protein
LISCATCSFALGCDSLRFVRLQCGFCFQIAQPFNPFALYVPAGAQLPTERLQHLAALLSAKSPSLRNKQKIPELWVPLPLDDCMKTYCWFNRNHLLSHLRTSFWALAVAGASLTLPSAEAGTPQAALGNFYPCFNYAVYPPRQVGENVIITFNVTTAATGTLTGSLVGIELDVVHPDGSITLHGVALFTGSVDGRSGTLLFTYNGIGNAVTGHENLRFAGRQGTGDLVGAYVQGTAEGDLGAPSPGCDVSGAGTYTGHVVFAR